MGHHGGRLLMAHVDSFDVVFGKAVQQRFDVSAGKGKDHADFFHFRHVLGGQVPAGDGCHKTSLKILGAVVVWTWRPFGQRRYNNSFRPSSSHCA